MVRKKIDNRIRHLIDNGVSKQHRSMFVIVGDKGRDQVVILHHMLSKSAIKARPDVLWCYKKELGFSSNKKKRMRELNKKIKSGKFDVNEDDPFELFIASTNIRYCYYSESHKILGNTYGMCVLQDFEALTPNLLARTIETVEGGGIVVILLRSVASLRQLYTMTMDVHSRFRTEAHQDVVGRFNERFILSLGSCENCLVMDDSLNILPISTQMVNIPEHEARREEKTPEDVELTELKDNMRDVQPVGALLNLCKTYDQAKALLKFIDAISEKRLNATVSLTAARGRGKSAALGLAIAAAVAFRFSSIYVTSPSPENLKTLFQFILNGFKALEYQEHLDFEVIQSSNPEFNKAVTRINFFKDHRQTIQYIEPSEAAALGQAELVVIDEAAAIPLPLVKSLFGPHLVFMASTINGYEGTGRSLSLKLLQQIRDHKIGDVDTTNAKGGDKTLGRTLAEVTLDESIRYKQGDAVEKWLTNLLCLDATLTPPLTTGCPPPDACDLYYINRDTLFCYHKASEAFLQKLMSLYVASHYKNSPNDLQMLSDAPAHHLFALLGPTTDTQKYLPDVLAVVQVCLEGEISKGSIAAGLARGQRAAGDLIPWTVAQQFHDQDFPLLSGGRVVRVAVHPDYQSMGYGTRALKLLEDYYNEKFVDLDESSAKKSSRLNDNESEADILTESIAPRKNLPPLLLKLKERPPERLHYLGVSYGVTSQLLKFWKRAGYVPVYMRQTPNDLTGEHSCVMLKILSNPMAGSIDTAWLKEYWKDFKRRFVALLSYQFRNFSTTLAMSVLNSPVFPAQPEEMKASELMVYFIPYDVKRLELYTKNMADYHLIMDLVPTVARLFFLEKMGAVHISAVQSALLLGMGLQHKKVDELAKEFDLPGTQLLGLFNRIAKKTLDYMNKMLEESIENEKVVQSSDDKGAKLVPFKESLSEEFRKDEIAQQHKQKQELKKLQKEHLQQYAIKEDDSSWNSALQKLRPGSEVVSVGRKLGESESDSPLSKKLKVDNGGGSKGKLGKKKKGNKQKGNR